MNAVSCVAITYLAYTIGCVVSGSNASLISYASQLCNSVLEGRFVFNHGLQGNLHVGLCNKDYNTYSQHMTTALMRRLHSHHSTEASKGAFTCDALTHTRHNLLHCFPMGKGPQPFLGGGGPTADLVTSWSGRESLRSMA